MSMEPVDGSNRARLVLWLLFTAIGIAASGMIGLLVHRAKNRKPPAEVTEEAVPVSVKAIAARQVADAMTLPGRVIPARTVRYGVEKPGMVAEVLVDKGQAVKAGDVLLRLDQRQWTNMLRQADVQWREAEREVVRLEELRKRGAISDSDYDRAVAARDMARIAVDAAGVSLSQCVLRSTVNGVVEERFVEPGEQVPEGFHAFRVVETDSVKVRVDVPERDVAVVRVGQAMSFRVPGQSSREYTGTVSFVAAEGSAWNNAFAVELTVPNAAGELRPGMLAELGLVRRLIADAVVVPLGAVIPRKGRYVVFKAVGDRAVEQSVALETVLDAEAVIGEGLKVGDEVIVEGHRLLSDGRLVRRVAPPAGAPQP